MRGSARLPAQGQPGGERQDPVIAEEGGNAGKRGAAAGSREDAGQGKARDLQVREGVRRGVVQAAAGRHPLGAQELTASPSTLRPEGKAMTTHMLNSAWCRARTAVGLPQVRVHDLMHTLGGACGPPG